MLTRWILGLFVLCCSAVLATQDLTLEEIIKKNEDAQGRRLQGRQRSQL